MAVLAAFYEDFDSDLDSDLPDLDDDDDDAGGDEGMVDLVDDNTGHDDEGEESALHSRDLSDSECGALKHMFDTSSSPTARSTA